MMKLVELFKTPQLTSLLSTNSHTLVLGCLDPQTGVATRVTVKADMVALDDEALLFVAVESEGVELAPTTYEYDGIYDAQAPEPIDEVAPWLHWAITPRGEEFNLR